MNAPTTLDNLRSPAPREASLPAVAPGFSSLQSFELMQRAAKMLSHSTLVPVAYRAKTEIKEYGKVTGYDDNPNGLPNCVVALNMAQRMGADPLMVMQNLYVVEGRPSWSSQFIIAAINSCGRYSALRFVLTDPTEPTVVPYKATEWQDSPNGGKAKKVIVEKTVTVRHQSCYAWAIEKETGERLESPTISIQMAIDEGWLTKNGSKWQTMPEVMLRYRAAAFFGKIYAPELLMGLQTAEESADIIDINPDGSYTVQSTTVGEMRSSPAQRTTRAEAADVVGEQPTQQTPAADDGQQPGLDIDDNDDADRDADAPMFKDINRELLGAKSVEALDFARSLIAEIPDEKEQATLHQVATRRMRELTQAAEEPGTAAPAGRRARAPLNAD
ncbi:hypothetical protein PanNE5_29440 [Pandoraea sp. NE5]|uniref:hypothetical protein n=1 Tax=Pandoraea sp. NE5 TaxID=2904129 RepID=UPI0021C2AA19|nr:hypothetical protein [Pandoraea sp. NE5]BDD93504.1 hypothetical protein PanNE5_29440 [Pandoraea sp. NE5]